MSLPDLSLRPKSIREAIRVWNLDPKNPSPLMLDVLIAGTFPDFAAAIEVAVKLERARRQQGIAA